MPKVTLLKDKAPEIPVPAYLLEGKRHLTAKEIYILIHNRNTSEDPDWQNVWVSDVDGEFNPESIIQSEFYGFVILGAVRPATIKYHDLELKTGICRSTLYNVVLGDDCVVSNVTYLSNYRLGDRVMLFNIQEMCCTLHSKFGNGILKQGEPESNRIWIGVGNENDERAVLAFDDMIPADAYLWSRYREDKELMGRFVELTEYGNDGQLNTYGIVEDDAVIKNSTIIKDVYVGKNAYIKGAFKLKNITIHSSPDEPTQVGEGVELVNGILGYGCHVFYQAVAIRFVIGRNCQLKYGARLLNSILGDNSTVSCCELLNNLIFPFHEQHHNSSFLIASTVMGQSNIASAATIGSNHNSRSPDGEMLAGRGFWPGLCSDFKFNCRFASFVLVSKGSYRNELNITYPFSLVAAGEDDCKVHIIPGYWFLYNMFAIVRNKFKFAARDKRFIKVQHIETNPLAPDTIQEVKIAMKRLVDLSVRYLTLSTDERHDMTEFDPTPEVTEVYAKMVGSIASDDEKFKVAKRFLDDCPKTKFILSDDRAQKKCGALIYKPAQGYTAYKAIIKYFAVESLMKWLNKKDCETLTTEHLEELQQVTLYKKWVNAGGQVIPEEKVQELFEKIKDHTIENWQQVHQFYDECQENYDVWKARYAVSLLEYLYEIPVASFTSEIYSDITKDVAYVSLLMLESSISSREKDYTDFFRSVTFRNKEEMEAVLGKVSNNSFLKELKYETEVFDTGLHKLFFGFIHK